MAKIINIFTLIYFRFDALSHRSSRSSINVAKVDNLGTVSNTSTPLSGSLENMGGGGEIIRKIGKICTPSLTTKNLGYLAPTRWVVLYISIIFEL